MDNVIAPGCISPVATNLLKYVPSSATGQVVSLAPSPILDNNGMLRVDWNQSNKDLIFGHYYQDNTSYSTPIAGGNIIGYMGEAFTIKQQNGVVDDIYTFTPSIINQAVFGITNSVSSGALSSSISNSSLGINMPNYLEAFNPSGAVAVNVGNRVGLRWRLYRLRFQESIGKSPTIFPRPGEGIA